MRGSLAAVAIVAVGLVGIGGLGACGAGSSGAVTVFAASSLTESFEEVSAAFESMDGATVVLDLDGSARLATQIDQGAPADVFAAADRETMELGVASRGARRGPEVFARNELAIVVQSGNPAAVTGLGDLARGDLVVALADPAVPVGNYAAEALDGAGVAAEPATLEGSARGVVTKVSLGEADAGIVYVTDVTASEGAVDSVALPAEQDLSTEYLIAVLDDAPDSADDFMDLVLGEEGREILTAHGFTLP